MSGYVMETKKKKILHYDLTRQNFYYDGTPAWFAKIVVMTTIPEKQKTFRGYGRVRTIISFWFYTDGFLELRRCIELRNKLLLLSSRDAFKRALHFYLKRKSRRTNCVGVRFRIRIIFGAEPLFSFCTRGTKHVRSSVIISRNAIKTLSFHIFIGGSVSLGRRRHV